MQESAPLNPFLMASHLHPAAQYIYVLYTQFNFWPKRQLIPQGLQPNLQSLLSTQGWERQAHLVERETLGCITWKYTIYKHFEMLALNSSCCLQSDFIN